MPGIEFDFAQQAANVEPAVRMLYQTYTDVLPYPHKFNDALLKAHLQGLDFAVNNLQDRFNAQQVADHSCGRIYTTAPFEHLQISYDENALHALDHFADLF